MKKCFIVCPIGDDNTPTRKRSDSLFKHIITAVCSSCDFEPIRVDQINDTGSITESIINNLHESDLVLADLTDHNPNAFFELGYRFSLGKPVILLCEKGTPLPFDLAAIRTFFYDLSDLDAVYELKNRLVKTIQSMNFDNVKPVIQTQTPNFNEQILQEVFKIQDLIMQLTNQISSKDNNTVSVLADKLLHNGSKTSEATLIETLLPALLNDPDKFVSLMEMMKKYSD